MEKKEIEIDNILGFLRFDDFNISRDNTFFKGFTIYSEDNDPLMEALRFPKKVEGAGFCICLQGECEFSIDQKNYRIRKNDLCAVSPYAMLQFISRSDDFVGYTLVGSIDFIADLSFPSKTMTYLYIKENPCIHLSDEEKDMIISMCELTKAKDQRISHPYRKEIAVSQLATICYELAAIYKKVEPLVFRPSNRREALIQKFLIKLSSDYKHQRNIEYYADYLCITPKYLSSMCKAATGKSASEWIATIVIVNAKSLLRNPNLSVKEVSGTLDFPNPSFFGQYFKRHTGKTPKEYKRTSQINNKKTY